MRILVAPDKFKHSLGAAEVAVSIAAGLRDVLPDAEIALQPIADGGEGTANVICAAAGGQWHRCEVHDPLGGLATARYCTIADGSVGVMEMSEASGLWRVAPERRDAVAASSFGTGEMLSALTRQKVEKIIIGLGGSATNDGGFGMARAHGFRFLDADGGNLTGGVAELLRLDCIARPSHFRLPRITAAVDVQNPLLGPHGATRVFGAQKGATAENVELLERALTRLADVVARDLGVDHRDAAGSGAAGGLGFGLTSFCAADLQPGFDLVAEQIGLEAAVKSADVVITGEGRLDAQTLQGKAPSGVARLARKHAKRVYAVCGSADPACSAMQMFDYVWLLAHSPMTEGETMARTGELLRMQARELARVL